MAGFRPVGSFPVASVPAGTVGAYSPLRASIVFSGITGSVAYKIPPLKTTWIGAEVLHSGSPCARVTFNAVEVLRSTASIPTQAIVTWIGAEVLYKGISKARVSTMAVEVLRSIATLQDGNFTSIVW